MLKCLLSVIMLFIAVCAVVAAGVPAAVFYPGCKDTGLESPNGGDGRWETKTVAGRKSIQLIESQSPPNLYVYFKLNPKLRAEIGSEAWLVVDFYDQGLMSVRVEYNSSKKPYEQGPGFMLSDSGSWQKALIRITDAEFAGLQNHGSDFRLAGSGELIIAGLEVYTEKPEMDIPSDMDRFKKIANIPQSPRDMYYTFGNDADEPSALLYKTLGVTSVESYVTWETCEREAEGKWDWTQWDKQVQVLKETGLKWVPFLILGPAYSTPKWFRESKDHYPCRCLEHGEASKIESLWNPNLPKYIDRFISEFAARYKDSKVIESVLLGIQGDYGEAIYSVSGGGWTFQIPGEYHNHEGFWCDDEYALADFRKFAKKKYPDLDKLNKAWGTSWVSFDEVDFPGKSKALQEIRDTAASGNPSARRRWLDFVEWYRASMTQWSDFWIATTRKYFPSTPVYLCTGGDAPPAHGSNFAEQCRVAAAHKAGVRITNEASEYKWNFVITRWVASACKHYGAYYGFEPAGAEDERGIVARIYNATASGANQLHDYAGNVTATKSRIDTQKRNYKWLKRVKGPRVPVALYYPNTSMTLKWGGYFDKAAKLRDITDWDYVDETMLQTMALTHYKVLVMLHGDVIETNDMAKIVEWVGGGGRLIAMNVPRFEDIDGSPIPEEMLFDKSPDGRDIVSGKAVRVSNWDSLADALNTAFTDLGLPVYDLKTDDVYLTQIDPYKYLILNTSNEDVEITITEKGRTGKFKAAKGEITETELTESIE